MAAIPGLTVLVRGDRLCLGVLAPGLALAHGFYRRPIIITRPLLDNLVRYSLIYGAVMTAALVSFRPLSF